MANLENLKKRKSFKKNDPRINRAGRTEGTRNRSTVVMEVLSVVADMEDISPKNADLLKRYGLKTKGKLEMLMTAAQVIKSMSGDTRAYEVLIDSIYGKISQPVEHTGKMQIFKIGDQEIEF